MESVSQIYGDHGTEECRSSESGWTMYIGSPINGDYHHEQEDDDGDEDIDYEDHHDDHHDGGGAGGEDDDDLGDREEVDSDDSMASDASSGPSAYPFFNRDVMGTSPGKFHENSRRCRFEKMESKKMEKQSGAGRRTKEEKGVVFVARTNTCGPAHSAASKSIWTSKSK